MSLAEMKPRSYQLELVDYLEKQNGIVYLPTGAGKTFIALLALRRLSHELQKPIENGGKRSIFMTNTVELARQQFSVIKNGTNIKVGLYVGERGVDSWTPAKWVDEIRENQVLVGTAQVFVNIIQQKCIKISDLCLVVIDECHHGKGQHPMHEFMRLFEISGHNCLPRVIGLTGVLLKGNCSSTNAVAQLMELEATYRGKIVTINDSDDLENIMLYSTKPQEYVILYNTINSTAETFSHIKSLITMFLDSLNNCNIPQTVPKMSKSLVAMREPSKKSFIRCLFNDFIYQMEDFGIYTASIAIVSIMIEFILKVRQADTLDLRRLYRAAYNVCEEIRHILMNKLRDSLEDDEPDTKCNSVDIILNYSSNKMQKLLVYLTNVFGNRDPKDISCLIFVERRHTAKCVYAVIEKFIKSEPKLTNVLTPQFLVGRNACISLGFEGMLETKWTKTALQSFRDAECNLIVCSNVLEEGIDVQACNYVLVLDDIKSFNSYVQTKGRARSKISQYVMFAAQDKKDEFAKRIKDYNLLQEVIKDYLKERVLQRNDDMEDAIKAHFDSQMQPLFSRSGGILLPSSALPLLHRYCNELPGDAFGMVLPWFSLVTTEEAKNIFPNVESKYVVSVKLPLSSVLREVIYGDPQASLKLAKISAAFKACCQLYEMGELNDSFIPKTAKDHIAQIADVHFQHWKKFNDDVNKSQKNAEERLYDSKCPKQLYDCLPRIGETAYAYKLKYVSVFDQNEYNTHIYTALKSTNSYAILLRNKLPHLATMPLFANQGQIDISFDKNPIKCVINNPTEIYQLQMFHLMLFRDLLKTWHSYFVMDKRSKEYSYLVVPIKENSLNWDLIQNFQRLPSIRRLMPIERERHSYSPEDYENVVVTQWYANNENRRFVVNKVRKDLTPNSKMNIHTSNTDTFAEYTVNKYRSDIGDIYNKNQNFLIEVRELSQRSNFFINSKGKQGCIKKKFIDMILIPELCFNFKYPADLWIKAMFLPCILHRLKFMLHAEHLRCSINKFLKIDQMPINGSNYTPKPLIIDVSLRRNFDELGNAIPEPEHEEPKAVLPQLPTKSIETGMKKSNLQDMHTPWLDFMEPLNYGRNMLGIYPVELGYYANFMSGKYHNMDEIVEKYEGMCSSSQFETPKHIEYENFTSNRALITAQRSKTILAIANIKRTEQMKIDILTRSTSDNSKIIAAEQSELLAALTASGAADVFDMERFEVLGDAFLKFSVALYLTNRYQMFNEGVLTEIKSKIVSNRNLLYCLSSTDITGYICKSNFLPKYTWLPPCTSLPYNILDLWEKQPNLAKYIGIQQLYEININEEQVTKSGIYDTKELSEFINECKLYGNHLTATNNEIYYFLHKELIRDKIVADTLEAILGVCVKNYGIYNSFRLLEYFGILKSEPNRPLDQLLDFKLGSMSLRTNISQREVDGFLLNYQYLENNLGYKFKDRAYLLQALTHPSFPTNRITGCYQELEFIGDAILDFLISAYIMEHNATLDPGQLTDLRSALVNNVTLACICVRQRFHLYLLSENAILTDAIKVFADYQETQHHCVTDQVLILMEEKSSLCTTSDDDMDENEIPLDTTTSKYNLSRNVDVPKALGDIVEAIIAAIYLDCRDLTKTWEVVYNLFEPELIQFSRKVPINAIRRLLEHPYANPKFSSPIVEKDVIMVTCEFTCMDKTIEVSGFGMNSKQAKEAAAKYALQKLNKCEKQ